MCRIQFVILQNKPPEYLTPNDIVLTIKNRSGLDITEEISDSVILKFQEGYIDRLRKPPPHGS